MSNVFCPQCRLRQPAVHAFCLRCGEALPAHLLHGAEAPAKAARFFAGVRVGPNDPDGAFLRVSCYLREQTFSSPEGSVTIPGRHVRFSVWTGEKAQCVISIPETEATELARFITMELAQLRSPADDAAAKRGSTRPGLP